MTGLAPGNIRLCTLALDVKTKFSEVFKRFSTYHMMFNSGSTVDIQTLGLKIYKVYYLLMAEPIDLFL